MKAAGSRWLCCLCDAAARPKKRARLASTSAVTLPPLAEARQVLRELSALLPRLQPSQAALWQKRIAWAQQDLTKRRRARLAVLGEPRSGVSSLVTALLDDPFTLPPEAVEALYARRLTGERPLLLELADEQHEEDITGGLPLPASFLAKSGLDILESESTSSDERTECLYRSDHVTVVVDDLRGIEPVRDLIAQGVSQPGRLMVVENRIAGNVGLAALEVEQMFEGLRGDLCPELPWTTGARFSTALEAYRELRRAIQADQSAPASFATLFASSRLGDVLDACSSLRASQLQEAVTDQPAHYQLATAAFIAETCASHALVAAASNKLELDSLSGRIAELSATVEQARRTTFDALGVTEAGMALPPNMTEDAREAVELLFRRRVRWWQLPFGRVDDVRCELRTIVENLFLRTFESKLYFDAGAMQAAGVPADLEADILLESRPFNSTGPYHSPVLLNSLAQLENLPFPPDSLAQCVVIRRQQLSGRGGPLDSTAKRAQLAVLKAYATVALFGGTSALWWSSGTLSTPTATALGVFGVAVAAYGLSKGWAKAERRLLQDWQRVEAGLGYDLKSTLEVLLDDVVLAKSRATVVGLNDIVLARREEAIEAEAEARTLLTRAKTLSKMLTSP